MAQGRSIVRRAWIATPRFAGLAMTHMHAGRDLRPSRGPVHPKHGGYAGGIAQGPEHCAPGLDRHAPLRGARDDGWSLRLPKAENAEEGQAMQLQPICGRVAQFPGDYGAIERRQLIEPHNG